MKVLIIQPHSDDVIFSCFHKVIEYADVTILTIESDEKRLKEDKMFCDKFGMNLDTLNLTYTDSSYYGFFKAFKEVDDVNWIDWMNDKIGEDICDEINTTLNSYVDNFKSLHPNSLVIAPLGCGHPGHMMIQQFIKNKSDLFYRDFPHSYKRRGIKQLEKMNEFELVESVDPFYHDSKYDNIKNIYRSQSSLLFFEQGHIGKKHPEEIYKLR